MVGQAVDPLQWKPTMARAASRTGRRLTRVTSGAAALVLVLAGSIGAVEPPLQGGFRLSDPKDTRLRQAAAVSLGPLILGGVRTRTRPPEAQSGTCTEAVYVMLGAQGSKRTPRGIRLKQSDHVVAFFVFIRCTGDDEICVEGTSRPLAVAGCSGTLKVDKGGGVTGKVKLTCSKGIAATDPAFGMTAEEQGWLTAAFPDLGRKFRVTFKDPAGRQVSQSDLNHAVENFNAAALDDVVGTYLANDSQPSCR